jgi:hypothetical protein
MGQEQSKENIKETGETGETGENNSGLNKNSEKEEYYNKLNEILDLSNKLIDEYKNQSRFLNNDFCKKIQIAHIPKLGKLPNKVLANIFNDVSSNGSYSIVQIANTDSFKMNFFKKNLKKNDFFFGKKVNINENGIVLTDFDYIPNPKKFEQKAGSTKSQLLGNDETISGYTQQSQQSQPKFTNNYKNNKQVQQVQQSQPKFTKNYKNNKQVQQVQQSQPKFTKNYKNNKQVQQQSQPKFTNNYKNNKQVKQVQQQSQPKFTNNYKNNKNTNTNIKTQKNKELNAKLKELDKTIDSAEQQSENIKTFRKTFENCKETGDDCVLNKYEVCKKITYNYLYRLNILSAIYHILPRKTTDNKFTGSFYYNRILALKDGNMCIPKNIDKFRQSSDTEKISFLNNILKDIDIDNTTCKELYKNSYTLEELSKLKGDSEFARKHTDIKHKMESNYKESLETLYVVILKLKTEAIISNSELFDISKLTKKTIDDMYYDAQFIYIMSVLNYIKYNTP